MSRRLDIVDAARSWIGTPYRHQASCKGAGTDCLGLVLGVWREVVGEMPAKVPPDTADWSEVRREDRLWRAAARYLVASDDAAAPGQVLLFRMRESAVAKHLGIAGAVGDNPTVIHALSGHAVLESPLSQAWARRIVARFDFPDRRT